MSALVDAIAPRGSGKNPTAASVLDGDPGKLEQAVNKEEGRATLRLKKEGHAVVEEVVSGSHQNAQSTHFLYHICTIKWVYSLGQQMLKCYPKP